MTSSALKPPSNGTAPRRGRSRLARALRELLLTSGAVAGIVCILAALAAATFEIRPLVFRSGSMSPAIHTGALGVARTVPAHTLVVGDVVSVTNSSGVRITHRITALTHSGDTATLTLKGDANRVADAEPYHVTKADRLILAVNGLGYVVTWFSTRIAVFLGGLVAGVLLTVAFRSHGRRHGQRRYYASPAPLAGAAKSQRSQAESPATRLTRRPNGTTTTALGLLALAATTLTAAPFAIDTEAAWTDRSTAPSGTLATLTVPVPSNFRCEDGLLQAARLRWTAVSTQLYRLTFTPTSGEPVVINLAAGTSSYEMNTAIDSGSVRLRTTRVYPQAQWMSAQTVGVGYNRGLLGAMSCA